MKGIITLILEILSCKIIRISYSLHKTKESTYNFLSTLKAQLSSHCASHIGSLQARRYQPDTWYVCRRVFNAWSKSTTYTSLCLQFKWLQNMKKYFKLHLNNYFNFHVCLSFRPSVRPPLSVRKLTSIPAVV